MSESEEEESKVAKPLKKSKKEQPLNLPNKPQAKSKAPLASKKNTKPSKTVKHKKIAADNSDLSQDESKNSYEGSLSIDYYGHGKEEDNSSAEFESCSSSSEVINTPKQS